VEILGLVGIFIITALITSLLGSVPVYFLWNWLMPKLFGLGQVTFMEAMGLLLLASCLFQSRSSASSKSG